MKVIGLRVHIIFLIFHTVHLALSQQAKPDRVDAWFFEESEYYGGRINIDIRNDGTCYNLDDIGMAVRVSSIALFGLSVHNWNYEYCIFLFDQDDCSGQSIKLDTETYCFHDLSLCEINMDKLTRSVMLC